MDTFHHIRVTRFAYTYYFAVKYADVCLLQGQYPGNERYWIC